MSGWTTAWLFWIAMFFAIEMPAVFNKQSGDTLTEHLVLWFSVTNKSTGYKWRRLVLISMLAWLSAHLLSGGNFV